jgi:hypothetical protein
MVPRENRCCKDRLPQYKDGNSELESCLLEIARTRDEEGYRCSLCGEHWIGTPGGDGRVDWTVFRKSSPEEIKRLFPSTINGDCCFSRSEIYTSDWIAGRQERELKELISSLSCTSISGYEALRRCKKCCQYWVEGKEGSSRGHWHRYWKVDRSAAQEGFSTFIAKGCCDLRDDSYRADSETMQSLLKNSFQWIESRTRPTYEVGYECLRCGQYWVKYEVKEWRGTYYSFKKNTRQYLESILPESSIASCCGPRLDLYSLPEQTKELESFIYTPGLSEVEIRPYQLGYECKKCKQFWIVIARKLHGVEHKVYRKATAFEFEQQFLLRKDCCRGREDSLGFQENQFILDEFVAAQMYELDKFTKPIHPDDDSLVQCKRCGQRWEKNDRGVYRKIKDPV